MRTSARRDVMLFGANVWAVPSTPIFSAEAVSYTHLDVYKRQT